MMKIMKRYLFLLLAIFAITDKISAQKISNEDLLSLRLPPIEVLFENAKKSSMFEFYNVRMEGQELGLKTEKRSWLEYFSLSGTYQYGLMGMNSYTDLGSNFPIVYQNSGGKQIWYNVGGSLRIPLASLFDRRNRIKTQQLKIKETLKERDLWYDQQKVQIIEMYDKAQSMLNSIQYVIELVSYATANYDLTQKDYVIGATTMTALNTAKFTQMQSLVQLENLKSELIVQLHKLEIISYTTIIKK